MFKYILIIGLFCTFVSASEVNVSVPSVVQAQVEEETEVVYDRRKRGKGKHDRRRGGHGLR